MAIAIQTKQAVRGITAVAERPDRTRINFLPFPTPVLGEAGELLGAVNMLIDVTEYYQPNAICDHPVASQDDRVKSALSIFSADEIRDLVEEIESRLNLKPSPVFSIEFHFSLPALSPKFSLAQLERS